MAFIVCLPLPCRAWSGTSSKLRESDVLDPLDNSLREQIVRPLTAPGIEMNRRNWLVWSSSSLILGAGSTAAEAKCTDIDSCREIGERKEEEFVKANPVTRLPGGVQFRVLAPGLGAETVGDSGKVSIAYSIVQANGSYMYSRGMGYNKIDLGNGQFGAGYRIT